MGRYESRVKCTNCLSKVSDLLGCADTVSSVAAILDVAATLERRMTEFRRYMTLGSTLNCNNLTKFSEKSGLYLPSFLDILRVSIFQFQNLFWEILSVNST